jgi:hypothetical protein
MEFGARRIDFFGLKFQLADEMEQSYQCALIAQASSDPKLHRTVSRELSDINGVNGRLQDIAETYAQLRDLFAQTWLRTNRPSGLRFALDHYDRAVDLWLDGIKDPAQCSQPRHTGSLAMREAKSRAALCSAQQVSARERATGLARWSGCLVEQTLQQRGVRNSRG